MNTLTKKYATLLLLCLGYFIDFYDLTIMGVGYNEIIKEQFGISKTEVIQQTYLLISNFQTVGIFIGAILFGILGDKLGRATAIKYSILLYSIATLLAIYTHSLPVFIGLRTLAYIGLATEFSTSTILILELFPFKSAAFGTALLYSFGVLGGITATGLGLISWKIMFLFGGMAGLILYAARNLIKESDIYLNAKISNSETFGSMISLFTNYNYLINMLKHFIIIIPYFALITIMFILPNYIIKSYSLAYATKLLLFGFFAGNIISSLLSALYSQFFINRKPFLIGSIIILLSLMLSFNHIPENKLFIYSIGLGLMGGGYPISWAQEVANKYPLHIRSLASNTLFALGRASGIGFNTLISAWVITPQRFIYNAKITITICSILAFIGILTIKKTIKGKLSADPNKPEFN